MPMHIRQDGGTLQRRGGLRAGITPSLAPVTLAMLPTVSMYTGGDSYTWAMHSGSLTSFAQFSVWSGTQFAIVSGNLPSGLASNSTHVYALVQHSDGSYGGLTPAGFTTQGILRDRMNTRGIPYAKVTKTEFGIPGTLLQAWGGAVPAAGAGHLTPSTGLWAGIPQAILADTNPNIVFMFTCDWNDIHGIGQQYPVVCYNADGTVNVFDQAVADANWTTQIGLMKTGALQVLQYLDDIGAAAGKKIEVIIAGKPNFAFRGPENGGVPVRYPPHLNSEPLLTHRTVTSGFGFFEQEQYDQSVEFTRYATIKATADRDAYVRSLGSNAHFFGPPPNYGYDLNSRIGFYVNTQSTDFAQDVINGSQTLNQFNNFAWTNMVRNIHSTTLGVISDRVKNDCWKPAVAAFATSPNINAQYLELRKSPRYTYETVAEPMDAYTPMAENKWIEGVHLNDSGFADWCDAIIDAWMPVSQFYSPFAQLLL